MKGSHKYLFWRMSQAAHQTTPLTDPAGSSSDRRRVLADCRIEHLIELIARGDRDAAAVLVVKYEPMLRRRIRASLSMTTRRLFDSQDVFATVCRRFDGYVGNGKARVSSPAELLALLALIAKNSVVDKGRAVRRLDRVEGEDSEFARSLRQRSRSAWRDDNSFEVDLQRCASHIESENDRVVFHQWLAGRSHEQIAAELGISPELARKRWQLIRERLKARLLSEGRL